MARKENRLVTRRILALIPLLAGACIFASVQLSIIDSEPFSRKLRALLSNEVIIGSWPELTTSYLLPTELRDEIHDKEFRILAFGPLIGAPDSPVDPLSANIAKNDNASPRLLATCAKTVISNMIGEEAVDFIFLEYHYCRDGLMDLTFSLKKRYPKAAIAIVDIWNPITARYINENGVAVSLKTWAVENGFQRKSVEMIQAFIDSTIAWEPLIIPEEQQCMEELQNKTEAFAIRKKRDFYPLPATVDEYKTFVSERLYLYKNDWSGLGKKGSEDATRGMAGFIKYTEKSKENVVGEWPVDNPSCSL